MGHSPNAVSMLGQRRRANIETALCEYPVFANTTCQLNAGLTLVHRRRLWPSPNQWRWCVSRVQADTDPMSGKCWASIAGSGQYPFSPGQYFMLAGVCTHSRPIHRLNVV